MSSPKFGNIVIYRPSQEEDQVYEYKEEYEIKDQITYAGSEIRNTKNLEIANQGGMIIFRICNKNLRRIQI